MQAHDFVLPKLCGRNLKSLGEVKLPMFCFLSIKPQHLTSNITRFWFCVFLFLVIGHQKVAKKLLSRIRLKRNSNGLKFFVYISKNKSHLG